jgi:hypothetical protein
MNHDWDQKDVDDLWDKTAPSETWKPNIDKAWKQFSVGLALGSVSQAAAAQSKWALVGKAVTSKVGMTLMAAAAGGASVYTYQAIQEQDIKPAQQEVVSAQPIEKRDTVAVMNSLDQPAHMVEKTIEKPLVAKPVETLKPETKILRFRQTELKVVAEILSQTYGVEVRIDDPEVRACKLTATFANESLETVLMIIQETFNFELRVDGKVQILKGGSCS